MMKTLFRSALIFLVAVSGSRVRAQSNAISEAPPEKRLPVFWLYCTQANLSDQDSVTAHTFLNEIIRKADSLGDRQLKAYAQYFKKCWRIFFSADYGKYFGGMYQPVVDILFNTQAWAIEKGYADIAASCDHSIGEAYYRVGRYGLAFEHFLKAHAAFEKIGYQQVPNASLYLYSQGLSFYRFAEYDKALQKFLEATRYEFYIPRIEINSLNTIGLIYARKNAYTEAISFFKQAIYKAKQDDDVAWIGIASGNIGNVWLAEHLYDSALFYHRINYNINGGARAAAPEDAAKTALSMATVFLHRQQLDSASYYMQTGRELGAHFINDTTESLDFRKRLLRVTIDYLKAKGEFRQALLLSDSLTLTGQKLTGLLDGKILSLAIEKTEALSYESRLALLESQKNLARSRYYISIAVLLLVLITLGFVLRDKWLRRKRQMLLAEKDKQILLGEKLRAEDGLKHAKELLNAYVDTIKEKSTLIEHLELEVMDLKNTLTAPELQSLTANREKLLRSTILTNSDWHQFRILFEQVYPGFPQRLKAAYPDLSPAESRFLFLARLDLSSKEMATMLGISVDAIHKLKYRLRKKISLEEESDFEAMLQKVEEVVVRT